MFAIPRIISCKFSQGNTIDEYETTHSPAGPIGLKDPEYIKLTADPLFVAPGDGGTDIDMTDPE